MLTPLLLAVLATAERPNFDAFVASPPLHSLGEGLPPAARSLLATAHVSGFEPRTGVPTVLWAPPGQPRFRDVGLTAEQAARRYLFQWAPVYRFAPAALADATLDGVHDLGGPVVATFVREAFGKPVVMQRLTVVMTPRLELVALTGNLSPAAASPSFALTAQSAIASAARDLTGEVLALPAKLQQAGWTDHGEARARACHYALPHRLVPAYQVELDGFGYVVSAEDGAILTRVDLTAEAGYRAWADPAPPYQPWDGPWNDATPHPDGTPTSYVGTLQPAPLVTLPHAGLSTNDPWLPVGAQFLEGNHAVAYADLFPPDGRNDPDAGLPVLADGGMPDGGFDDAGVPYRLYPDPRVPVSAPDTFDYVADFTKEPSVPDNRHAGGVNAFFIVNWLHDVFYDLGFDEKAGNTQADNYGRGGVGGDPMLLELLDFSGRDNASMRTPADGRSPRMHLFVWTSRGVQRVLASDGGWAAAPVPYDVGRTPGWNVTGDLVEPIDSADGGNSGCSAPVNAAALEGKIALTGFFGCGDAVRIARLQDAGSLGVVVARAGTGFANAGTPPFPAHSVDPAVAAPWRATLAQAGTVTTTLDYPKSPDRDTAVDMMTVAHEWTHHLTNRLIGDAFGLVTGQSRGMGEGWSDFVGVVATLRASDATAPSNPNWNGTWGATPFNGGGTDALGVPDSNFYYGLGRYPYTADAAKNPLRFRHISKGVNQPLTPRARFTAFDGSEVHATGEVWATMLWECQVRLLRSGRYTVPQGRAKMLGYLVAALKATPLQPTFTEARDALLAVTRAASAADDFPLFVEAFASRGLGLGAVAPPKEATGNAPLQEDGDVTGARWKVVSFAVTDGPTGACDSDGFLDDGEAGEAVLTLMNVGAKPLAATTVAVTASEPRLKLPAVPAAVPATPPFGTAVVKLPVSLPATGGALSSADFTVTVSDPQTAAPLVHQATVRLDTDRVASATEGFEDAPADYYRSGGTWNAEGDVGAHPSVYLFRPVALSPLSHVLVGHDLPVLGESAIESPALQVGAAPFSFTFVHSYVFDTSAMTNFWDGGILEISTDGFDWKPIPGSAITPTYDGTIRQSGNPLANSPAFVGIRPVPVVATVSLGTQYANQTVWIRFRIGSDASIGAAGWTIDDVAFTGLTNTPFSALVPHRRMCGANLPPTVTPPADFAADERTSVMLAAQRTADPNGDPVSVAWSVVSGPAATIAGNQLTLPDVPATTALVLRATASDGKGGMATADFTVTVRNVNRAPTATASAQAEVTSGATAALNATATDPDGDPLTYAWAQTGGAAVTLTNGASASASFTAPDVTEAMTLSFAVTVSDGAASFGPVPVDVKVNPKPKVDPKPMPKGCGCAASPEGMGLLALLCVALRRARKWLPLALVLGACGSGGGPVDAGTGGGSGGGGGGGAGGGTGGGTAVVDAGSDAGAVDAGSVDAGPPDAGPFDAGHRTLTLPRFGAFTTAPDASLPDNPPAGVVKVTCPVVEDGGWEERQSTTVQPGLMQVTDVRDADCIVFHPAGGVVTRADAIDFSARFVGRATAPAIPSGTTPNLALSSSGFTPWVPATDDLLLASFETGYSQSYNVKTFTNRPAAGATAASFSLNYAISGLTTPGLSAAAGDQFVVAQLRTFATPTPHRVPIAVGAQAAPTITGAGTVPHTAVVGPLTPVPLMLDHDFGDYAQQAVENHPDATAAASSLTVQAQPAFGTLGWVKFSSTGSGFTYALFQATTAQQQGAYTMAPEPAGTTAIVVALQNYSTQLMVPGVGSTLLTSTHQRMMPLSAFTLSLPPALSPPQNLKVNGVPAATQTTGTGTRPRVTWDAPRLGVPDAYQVTVLNAVTMGTTARFVSAGAVRTRARSYTVPAGMISGTTGYVVVVRALKGGQFAKADEAFPASAAEEHAEALSAVLVP